MWLANFRISFIAGPANTNEVGTHTLARTLTYTLSLTHKFWDRSWRRRGTGRCERQDASVGLWRCKRPNPPVKPPHASDSAGASDSEFARNVLVTRRLRFVWYCLSPAGPGVHPDPGVANLTTEYQQNNQSQGLCIARLKRPRALTPSESEPRIVWCARDCLGPALAFSVPTGTLNIQHAKGSDLVSEPRIRG